MNTGRNIDASTVALQHLIYLQADRSIRIILEELNSDDIENELLIEQLQHAWGPYRDAGVFRNASWRNRPTHRLPTNIAFDARGHFLTAGVDLKKAGRLVAQPRPRVTSIPGVFARGDVWLSHSPGYVGGRRGKYGHRIVHQYLASDGQSAAAGTNGANCIHHLIYRRILVAYFAENVA